MVVFFQQKPPRRVQGLKGLVAFRSWPSPGPSPPPPPHEESPAQGFFLLEGRISFLFGVQTLTRTGRQDRGQQDVSKVLEVSSQAVPGLLGGPGLGRLVGPPGAAGSDTSTVFPV